MLHLRFVCLVSLLFSFSTKAQHSIQGRVIDYETYSPLPGATVYIPDLKKGSVSNAEGIFSIDGLPAGKFLVEVKLIGYVTWVQPTIIRGFTELEISLTSAVTELNEVVITGISYSTELKKNSIPISTINNQALSENVSSNIIDNISKKPGMSQISTGAAISKPVIRGLSYNRIITLVDGIRQEGQQWGDEHGIELDEYAVDRVEIIKGAGSLMYGGDGLGGVIHFLGSSPAAAGSVVGNWKSNYQTNNGLIGNSILVKGNHSGIYWSLRGSQKIAKSYENRFDKRVFNAGFVEKNLAGTIGLNKKWGYSELSLTSFNQSVGLVEGDRDSNGKFTRVKNDNGVESETTVTPAELNSYSLFIPKQNINHLRVSSTSNIYFTKGRVQVNAAYQRNHRREFGNVLDQKEAELFFDLQTLNYNLIYFFPQKSEWELSVGTSGMAQQNTNRGEEFIIPEYKLFDWGSFGFIKRPFGNLDIAGGFRFDHRTLDIKPLYLDDAGNPTDDTNLNQKFSEAQLTFSSISASAGFTYEFSNFVTGKFNISRGFRAPNISELTSNGKHEGTLRYEYGNYDLKPETSLQLDVSMLLNSKHITAEISSFQNTIDHYIFTEKLLAANGTDSIPDPSDPSPAFRYTQGNAKLIGAEVLIDIHPHPLDWLHFENSFSFVRGVNSTQLQYDSSKFLPFIPAPRLQSELRATAKKISGCFYNGFIKIEHTYTWEQNRVLLDNGAETPTPSYSLWNLGMGTEIKSKRGASLFLFYFMINNVFDKAYQHHLSRLKYAAINEATGRVGVFNMGRNFSVKISVPITFKEPKQD